MGNKQYLGDGVYVEHDDARVLTVTTSNGLETTNTIVLEPKVYAALVAYAARMMEAAK